MTDDTGTEYMRAGEAQEYLGLGNKRMSELLKRGVFEVFESDVDRRVKLLKRSQVEEYATRLRSVRPKSTANTAA